MTIEYYGRVGLVLCKQDAYENGRPISPDKEKLTIEYLWARGEIGRRTRFRIWRSNAWGFDSLRAHHLKTEVERPLFCCAFGNLILRVLILSLYSLNNN